MSYQIKNFSELDFDTIRASLIQYLSTQEAFAGFDFKGTAINALVNLLAYNTQYNAFYLNMHASERFLSTAQRRENVVAIAKNLGYTPNSSKGGTTTLILRLPPSTTENIPTYITVPKHTVFTCSNEEESFTLYTEEAYTLPLVNVSPAGQQEVKQYLGPVKVFEGKKFTQTFVMSEDQNGFILPNKDVQRDKILVMVTEGSVTEEWVIGNDVTQISNSKVYFIEEVIGQKTKVYFGNGIVGARPTAGASVQITYFTSRGSAANGASDISKSDSVPGSTDIIIMNSLTAKISSGVDIESVESIRANAPLLFASQNRAVTTDDFKVLIKSKILPGVHSISCWGGEEDIWSYIDVQSNPLAQQYIGQPKLGYVFISILETANDPSPYTSIETKLYVESSLRNKYGVVTIFPEVVQPKITFLSISTNVRYDSTKSVQQQDLKEKILYSIQQDQIENYSEFQTTLRYSKLSTAIDDSSPYIISNNLEVSLYTEVTKEEMQSKSSPVSIGVPIAAWSLKSTEFTYTHTDGITRSVYLTDSLVPGNSVALAYRDNNQINFITDNSGNVIKFATVDRSIGTIDFYLPVPEGQQKTQTYMDFSKIQGITEVNKLRIYAKSAEKDVAFTRNIAPILRTPDIQIELTAE